MKVGLGTKDGVHLELFCGFVAGDTWIQLDANALHGLVDHDCEVF